MGGAGAFYVFFFRTRAIGRGQKADRRLKVPIF